MTETLPYLATPGVITTILAKIQPAKTPDRFDAKFLGDTLGLKGGSYRSFIPFAKRIGLLNPDGTPTELYKRFRTEGHSSSAIASAIQIGFKPLFVTNEGAHELSPKDLKSLVIQITGKAEDAASLEKILTSFGKLKEWANFATVQPPAPVDEESAAARPEQKDRAALGKLRLSYTINLNLPETSDPKVFAAIFKALKEHLLREAE